MRVQTLIFGCFSKNSKGVFLPMKSSDLKVVAIILSIALFFTIITSNAVSIASVVILAKGGTGAVQMLLLVQVIHNRVVQLSRVAQHNKVVAQQMLTTQS